MPIQPFLSHSTINRQDGLSGGLVVRDGSTTSNDDMTIRKFQVAMASCETAFGDHKDDYNY